LGEASAGATKLGWDGWLVVNRATVKMVIYS
jgi:hypothetical protein